MSTIRQPTSCGAEHARRGFSAATRYFGQHCARSGFFAIIRAGHGLRVSSSPQKGLPHDRGQHQTESDSARAVRTSRVPLRHHSSKRSGCTRMPPLRVANGLANAAVGTVWRCPASDGCGAREEASREAAACSSGESSPGANQSRREATDGARVTDRDSKPAANNDGGVVLTTGNGTTPPPCAVLWAVSFEVGLKRLAFASYRTTPFSRHRASFAISMRSAALATQLGREVDTPNTRDGTPFRTRNVLVSNGGASS